MSIEVNIEKKFKGFTLQVRFQAEHTRLGILGASGCGKSMTLKCIAGIEKPDKGRIVLDGVTLFDSEKKINLPPQKRRVGYLFQNYALFPTMTVEQNLSCALKGDKEEKAKKVREQIKRYQLQGLEKHLPAQMSGGQQQRAALARMMIQEPKMILLDEPFSAMDLYLRDKMQQEMLARLQDFPGEVIMVSHNRDEIYTFCPELTVMQDGRAIYQGHTKDIFHNPVYREVARLTGCKNIAAVERIDEHNLYAKEWNLRMHLTKSIEPDIKHIGIRAHQFVPAGITYDNKIECTLTDCIDTPFERQYLLKPTGGTEKIWWLIAKNLEKEAREAGTKEWFGIKKEDLMLLKEV